MESAAGEGELTGFFRDARAPRAKLRHIPGRLRSLLSHLRPRAIRGAPDVCSPRRRQLCPGALLITEPEAIGHLPSGISAHVLPPAPRRRRRQGKAPHPALGGNFAGWGNRRLSLGVFPSPPAELLGWEDANLPPCNEILFKKDLRFSHDPRMKVWAVFKHKSRNSQNVCAVSF